MPPGRCTFILGHAARTDFILGVRFRARKHAFPLLWIPVIASVLLIRAGTADVVVTRNWCGWIEVRAVLDAPQVVGAQIAVHAFAAFRVFYKREPVRAAAEPAYVFLIRWTLIDARVLEIDN